MALIATLATIKVLNYLSRGWAIQLLYKLENGALSIATRSYNGHSLTRFNIKTQPFQNLHDTKINCTGWNNMPMTVITST